MGVNLPRKLGGELQYAVQAVQDGDRRPADLIAVNEDGQGQGYGLRLS